jgi:zinc protease
VLVAAAIALAMLPLSASAAQPAPAPGNYGRIVSQTYDKQQQVTETHLANGLTILSKERHGAPVVYFSVWYRVGSRNERTGQTGLSHILEHMMFKGTKDLPPGAIDHLFLTNGGQINASTGTDRTEYHELIAADRLELAIRVEADRMENSLFDPVELRHEMTVVRSELEGDSNDPAYQLYAFSFLPAAFIAHPYHWPTLGWRSDVEAVADRRNVIYQYYKDHYMPNNAIVVMVGDFDTKKAVALCQKYFGSYGPGNLEHHYITPEPEQHGERRVVLRRPGTVGQVTIGYHAPALGAKDHYVMDVISQILSGGRSARMYQDMVETGIAQNADAGNQDAIDPFLFTLSATDRAGVSNADVEKALEAEVTKLQSAPVTAEELARAKNQIDASFTYQNDSVSEQADQIGTYAVIAKSGYRYLDTYLDDIHNVTAADIQRVAKQYLIESNRTVAAFEPQPLPPGQNAPPPASADNFGAAPPVTDPRQKAILAALDKRYNTGAGKLAASKVKPTRVVLPNGMVLIVEENHSNHTIAFSGETHAGSMYDPDGKWGLAGMTSDMLERGTTTKSALQLALTLESKAASVSFSAGTESANFGGQCLTKDFGLTLSTFADELLHPAFPADQLERLRGQTLSGLEEARQETGGTGGAGTQADIAFAQALYPKGHPYWSPTIDQQEASVKSITADDMRSFYSTYYRPDTTIMTIVGDITTKDAVAKVESLLGGWAKPATPAPAFNIPDVPIPAKAPAPKLIALPDATQTSILWGFPGQLKRTSKDFYPAYIMNYILGGDPFASRLGKTIRDRDGLAYTVYSYFDAGHGAGPFEVFVGANPNNAGKAIGEIRAISQQLRTSGITDTELTAAKEYLTGSYPLRLETNAGIAGQLLVSEEFNLGLDYIQKRASIINAVTIPQVNAAAKKYLHPTQATLVIAGATPSK